MAEKKIETPIKKGVNKRIYGKIFFSVIVAICVLGGLSIGIFVQRHFVKGMFVPQGIGNSFKGKAIFYPDPETITAVVSVINSASKEVLVMSDAISAKVVIEALLAKMQEGIPVRLILDRNISLDSNSPIGYLYKQGMREIFLDELSSTNQIMIIDSRYVILGNAPFSTRAASDTAGSFIVLDSFEIAQESRDYFRERYKKATRVEDLK